MTETGPMPNDAVSQADIDRKRRQEAREEGASEQSAHRADKSLEAGLEGTFPASDPVNVTQPREVAAGQEAGPLGPAAGAVDALAGSRRRCVLPCPTRP